MSLFQLCFTAHAKFLTSFLTIAISIVTWCRPYIFFFCLILAQHYLLFLLLIGCSSKGIPRTKRRRLSCLICHETQIFITSSLNRTLCPKIWASYCSAEYCPRMQKTHFRLTCVRLKTSFKLTIKMLNNINM